MLARYQHFFYNTQKIHSLRSNFADISSIFARCWQRNGAYVFLLLIVRPGPSEPHNEEKLWPFYYNEHLCWIYADLRNFIIFCDARNRKVYFAGSRR